MGKHDKFLARQHVNWYITVLRKHIENWLDTTETLMLENFIHGMKHGRELERRRIRNNDGLEVDEKVNAVVE